VISRNIIPPPKCRCLVLCQTATLVSACLMLLGGCAQLPSGEKQIGIKPVGQYQAQESFSGRQTSWPDDQWWRAYGDAQLDALIAEGLKDSPTMAIAEARLRRAKSLILVADSALQPQVNAHGSATMQKQSYNYLMPGSVTPQGWNDYGQATLDFSWEIDFWGKNRAALEAATSLQEASAADAAQARLALTSSIASAYGELDRLYALHDTVGAAINVRKKNLELLQKRRKHGMETLGSVRQSEARKASTEEDLLVLDEQISLQRNRIAALIGAGPDRGLAISRPNISGAKNFGIPRQMQLELIGRRPDIVAARLRVEASEKSIEKQRAEFYPNINLSAFIGLQSLGLNKLTDSGSRFGSVGPAISLPIFNGGRLRGQLRSTQAEHDEAVGNYNLTVTQALQEVADAAVSQRALGKRLEKLEQEVAAARDAHRNVKLRYEGGLSNYLDVLSSEEILLSSLRTLRDMQSRSFTLDVALIKALGGGYQAAVKN